MSIYQRLAAVAVVAVCGLGTAACSTSAAASPTVLTSSAPTTAMPVPSTRTEPTSTTAPKTPAATRTSTPAKRSNAGCGQRAVTAGKFDPSCKEYQGYLDPGTAAGRARTSGELQMQYLCRTGQVPGSQC